MSPTKIETPREYFDAIVTPDVLDFGRSVTSLRHAYHACISILSLRDWVALTYHGNSWSYRGTPMVPFPKPSKPGNTLQSSLETINGDFKIVTDIANASKHMVLERGRTTMWGSANAEVQSSGGATGASAIGSAPIGGTTDSIQAQVGSNWIDVLVCVNSAHREWTHLFAENKW